MLSAYPANFYKENDGSYSVIFPDLNHLSTCGSTLNQALEMSVDCLAGYLYSAKCNHEPIPQPSEIKAINPKDEYDEYDDVFVNIVTVNVEEYAKKHFEKSVKKTLTIPSWLNELALENNINFSAVLQNALKKELNIAK